jgi:triosephosphate isomerase
VNVGNFKARQRWVIGNWKMHGSLASNEALISALAPTSPSSVRSAVCVPAPYLAQVQQLLQGRPVHLGAQDVSEHSSGAYTGQVSVKMLVEFGVDLVIVGHCECRQYHGDTSERVARKVLAALRAGLQPVLCVGETLAERDLGHTFAVLAQQMTPVAQSLSEQQWQKLIIAYEPVWAIGTGKSASPEHAQEAHQVLRDVIRRYNEPAAQMVPILYGGSVKPANAAAVFAMSDVDGGLIGGASLVADDFNAIVAAAAS